jgi:hypothetical protein
MSLMALSNHQHLRLGLVASYFLLVLFFNPVLIGHDFAKGSDGPHSDRDVCAWLDNAAGSTLHSAEQPLTFTRTVAALVPGPASVLFYNPRPLDPIRGPPLSR